MSSAELLAPSRSRSATPSQRREPTPVATNGEATVDTSNLSYLEGLYHEYLKSPDLVSPEWREYFRHLSDASLQSGANSADYFKPQKVGTAGLVSPVELEASIWQERVGKLIRNYRAMGHYAAQIDPLGRKRPEVKELELASCELSEADLDRTSSTVTAAGPNLRTLREILQWLKNTYCRSIGSQFMHIDDIRVREWLQQRMEGTENRIALSRDQQLRILKRLSDAVVFEEFIQKKFMGKKTFSLEGAETLIPLLDQAIYHSAGQGVEEVVLGMAHRGRLNVLTSIMGKSPRAIFREFADLDPQLHVGRGDVKYNLGYSNDWYSGDGKKVHLSLCFNPSHLEFVNPVAMGRVRAKQDRKHDVERSKVMLILVHGDAAFAGEGVVQETLNINALDATKIGGTVHVVVNNQIGFTTDPIQARSTAYCTDVAKMLQIPIFHVNGEDPEAVAQCVQLALDFRREFKQDVVIDMLCYRLRGHNEQDEPEFTQPIMYREIKARKNVADNYFEHLAKLGEVSQNEADEMISRHRQQLESELEVAKSAEYVHKWDMLHGVWAGYKGGHEADVADVDTGVPVEKLSQLMTKLTTIPADFKPHAKIHNGDQPKKSEGLFQKRAAMGRGETPLDWGAAELLAYASLADEGYRVRLHGQDCERGTFSHRHAVVFDCETGRPHCTLKHLSAAQGPVDIFNSALSETGVLGFDYGYSLDCPDGIVCWEAQFGDFVNAAQVIIDQFIVSAEDKWNRLSGLVMLLPHGFEGQGPEHSSARLERFLTLAAEDNIQVAYPTTPAQHFHLLRRQVLRKWRKPLVVMTPKGHLRVPNGYASTLEDLSFGTFRRVLPNQLPTPAAEIQQILLCSGKIYKELELRREKLGRHDTAILRLEQLYPLPDRELRPLLEQYAPGTPVAFVQEEPENMGSWRFLISNWGRSLYGRHPFEGISRPASASPATGSFHSHEMEQQRILQQAFGEQLDPH